MQPDTLLQVLQAIQTRTRAEMIAAGLLIALATLASYFGARLRKSGELKEIEANFDKILSQQTQLAEATGKIKASLDQGNLRYQIQLSAYQQNAVQAIEDIYNACLALRDSAIGVSHTRAGREALFESSRAFITLYDKKKIWLPDELSEQIRQIANDLDLRSRRFMRAQDTLDNVQTAPQQAIQNACDEQDSFYDFVNQEIHMLFEQLSSRIRAIVEPKPAA